MIFDYPIVEVIDVHDGDTCHVRVDLGFGIQFDTNIRIDGIDTPEMATNQKAAAIVARDAFTKWLGQNKGKLWVKSVSWDKYGGRIVGRIYIQGKPDLDWTSYAIGLKIAKPYDGSKKTPWTQAELDAIAATKV
jgi:endonuclease YncB( thermonuclease family)